MSGGRFLLYDYLQVPGGAERVSVTLANAFPDLRLAVSRVFDEARALEGLAGLPVLELGTAATRRLGRVPESAWCFRQRAQFLRDAELVVYSGFYAPFAVHAQRGGRRLYYCHTPPRYAYDLKEEYRRRLPPWLRPAAALGIDWLRREYERAMRRMDLVIANSANVQARLRRYLGIEAEVLHPPVDTDRFDWRGDDGYFLSVARLTRSKRVDLAVRAFRELPQLQLVVLSDGPEAPRLRALADGAPNIRFVGFQSDAEVREWVGRCRALIYLPMDEDFGIAPVEAMAAGKPVIGVAEGGLLETVADGETGLLLPPELPMEALVEAIARVGADRAGGYRAACRERAQRFSRERFLARFAELLG